MERARGRHGLEATGAQRAQRCLGDPLVRRRHDACDAHARTTLEPRDAPQRLGGQRHPIGIGVHAPELAAVVVVAVDEDREVVAALPEQPRRAGMHEPRVQGDHRHREVVAVQRGVAEQLAVAQVPVGRPVQIRVVEDERGAQRRRLPPARRGESTDEVRQREESECAAGQQTLAQQLVGPQLVGRRGHHRAVAGGGPDRCAVEPREHRGALDGVRRKRGQCDSCRRAPRNGRSRSALSARSSRRAAPPRRSSPRAISVGSPAPSPASIASAPMQMSASRPACSPGARGSKDTGYRVSSVPSRRVRAACSRAGTTPTRTGWG